jgi:hypothetical protein
MRKLILRSFVNAQALVGIVLTVSWFSDDLDPQSAAVPLFTIAALLLMYSLVPAQWTRSPDRLESPLALDTAVRQIAEQLQPSKTLRRLGDCVTQHRFSIQLAITSSFLATAALLLHYVAPTPVI